MRIKGRNENPQSEGRSPRGIHPAWFLPGMIGVALLGVLLGATVTSLPSGFGNPSVFGHDPADIAPGTFSGTGTDTYVFPGFLGVRTASPASPLTVAGIVESTSGGVKFPDGSIQTTAATSGTSYWNAFGNDIANANTGDVGIGTNAPATKLDVAGDATVQGTLDVSGNKVINVATPTLNADAANKEYVDAQISAASGNLDCYTTAANYSGTQVLTCNTGYTIVSGSCNGGEGTVINDQTPTPPGGGSWVNYLVEPNTLHCNSLSVTTQALARCCKLG